MKLFGFLTRVMFQGPNESLFQKTYIESLKKSLRPGGIICSQAGSIWIKEDQETMARLSKDCLANFKKVTLATISIPSYPTGNISFLMATDNEVRQILLNLL